MTLQICLILRERWYIILPVCVGLTVTIVAGDHLNTLIPHDLNVTTWKTTIEQANETLHMTSTVHQIGFLLTLHFLQVIMFFPMMHVTKILYGFWLGPLWGWLLCCAWELTLIFVYLTTIKINPIKEIQDIVTESRAKGVLWGELVVLAMSSTPLQVKVCLVQSGGVTIIEFWTANVLVTCVLSFKNTICGYLLSTSFSVTNFALITTIITLSTLIPTIATVYVSSKTLYKCLQIYRSQRSTTSDYTDALLNEHSQEEDI